MLRGIHPLSTLLDSILSRRANIDERALHHCLNQTHHTIFWVCSAIRKRAPNAPDYSGHWTRSWCCTALNSLLPMGSWFTSILLPRASPPGPHRTPQTSLSHFHHVILPPLTIRTGSLEADHLPKYNFLFCSILFYSYRLYSNMGAIQQHWWHKFCTINLPKHPRTIAGAHRFWSGYSTTNRFAS
jgi:hypothetical protein